MGSTFVHDRAEIQATTSETASIRQLALDRRKRAVSSAEASAHSALEAKENRGNWLHRWAE